MTDIDYYVNLSVEQTKSILEEIENKIQSWRKPDEDGYVDSNYLTTVLLCNYYGDIVKDVVLALVESKDFYRKFELLKQYPHMCMVFYEIIYNNYNTFIVNLANNDEDVNNLELYFQLFIDASYKKYDTSKLVTRFKKHANDELINKLIAYAEEYLETELLHADKLYAEKFFLDNFNLDVHI